MTVFIMFERDGHPRDTRVFASEEDARQARQEIIDADDAAGVRPFARRIIVIRPVEVE